MVHAHQALDEAWRVLAPGGILCDIHPRNDELPLEIVAAGQVLNAGSLDCAPSREFSRAAEAALAQAVAAGRFVYEQAAAFSYPTYWDSLDELITHYRERDTAIRLPERVVAQAESLLEAAGPGAQLRTLRDPIMTRYHRRP